MLGPSREAPFKMFLAPCCRLIIVPLNVGVNMMRPRFSPSLSLALVYSKHIYAVIGSEEHEQYCKQSTLPMQFLQKLNL